MIRIISLFSLLLLAGYSLKAQNHVPNPGFEDKYACPTGAFQVTSHCKDWYCYSISTADYAHLCALSVSPPAKNYLEEYVVYDSGVAAMHMWPWGEHIATKILPLDKDSFYEVSLSTVLTSSGFAVDGMGAFFFKNFVDTYKNTTDLSFVVTPQVDYTRYGPISDSVNWTRLKGYFVADSAYDHMVIGQFKDSASIIRIKTLKYVRIFASYQMVDSVVVKKVRNINTEFSDSLLCAGDTIKVGCFVHPQYFTTGNVFTLQLSDGSGSFTNAIDIGSVATTQNDTVIGVIPSGVPQGNNYRFRIVANAPAYISDDNGFPIKIGPSKPARPSITTNTPICEGSTMILTATTTTPNVDWYWFSEFERIISTTNTYSKVVQLKDTGYYRVYASNGGCLSEPDSIFPAILYYSLPGMKWHISPGLKVNKGTQVTYYATPHLVGPNPVYHWYLDGKLKQSTTDSFYTGIFGTDFYEGDTICVKVYSNYLCKLRDSTYTCQALVKDLAGINDIENEQLGIYPNPAGTVVNIRGHERVAEIELYDIVGRRLTDIIEIYKNEHINITMLPVGHYFVILKNKEGIKTTIKLMKE